MRSLQWLRGGCRKICNTLTYYPWLTSPWIRLLVPGVFKPSCSTPFTPFLRLVSVYRPFQLYFIPKTLHNTSRVFSSLLTAYFYLTGHSPVFIYNTTLLHILLTLCGHLQTQRVCRALHPVSGEDGILVAEVPRGVQHASSARTSPRRVVGLARPNQSAGRALISIRRQRLRVNQGIEINFVLFLSPEYIAFWALVRTCWNAACVHPLVGLGGGWGQNVTKHYTTYNGSKTPVQKESTRWRFRYGFRQWDADEKWNKLAQIFDSRVNEWRSPSAKVIPFCNSEGFSGHCRNTEEHQKTERWLVLDSVAKGPRPKTYSEQTDLLTDQSRSQFTRPWTPLGE